MAAPTNTYVDYAAGNDYKGATFTDGAYTSATKTLVKASAFAASQVNHWLKLDDNGSGVIVDGYYKIATVTDANTVILATDAGGGSDATDVKCTQHDGTTTLPWRSVQGALDLITRDSTNGDQINVKTGTAVVNQAALTLARYGTPAEVAPLVIRGYTSAANDGGIGEIDAGGFTFIASTPDHVVLMQLEMHTFGNNNGVNFSGQYNVQIVSCEIHKGATTGYEWLQLVVLGDLSSLVAYCYIHDADTNCFGIGGACNAIGNYIENCPYGMNGVYNAIGNIIVDSDIYGIYTNADLGSYIGNTIYNSNNSTGAGIGIGTNSSKYEIVNNVIEGYSGSGGCGIKSEGEIRVYGNNAFYNNTTHKSLGDVIIDLGGDVTCTASPFADAASGDFAPTDEVKELAFPAGAWPGLATTENAADIGAVQSGAGAGGGTVNPLRGKLG